MSELKHNKALLSDKISASLQVFTERSVISDHVERPLLAGWGVLAYAYGVAEAVDNPKRSFSANAEGTYICVRPQG